MKRCVILLDGTEKNDTLRKELAATDTIVAVDRGLDHCFALDRPPRKVFLCPKAASEKAQDWATFMGVPSEDYAPGDGEGGFELALQWALTSPGINAIDVVNALGRSPVQDHSRLLVLARFRDAGAPTRILTADHRYFILSGGHTLNGRPGIEFSLVPLSPDENSITIKNGGESVYPKLDCGSSALLHQKLVEKTANLIVSEGCFLVVLPRS